MNNNNFVVFPSLGYWELDGNPVSYEDVRYLFSDPEQRERVKWRETEVAKNLPLDFQDETPIIRE